MSRSFLDAAIPELVQKLSTDEKIALLGAPNWWNTTSIPRLAIPPVRMSDGPNGVRGSSHFVPTPAQCLPCATSLASTFDPELIHEAGAFLAAEAKIKSSVALLAPTCNIQRTPLGGRAFESFSEDPHLSGIMAAAYVNGLQSSGVAATIKHFVGNDQEHERTAADSVMSDRALREIYLYPFMLAQKLAKPWAYMTSYGRINGVHLSENPRFLQDILRKEWGFDGLVMSDWFGTYSVDQSINAGLDLEMPGPPRWRTPLLVTHLLSSQKILESTLDARAETVLAFVQRLARRNPEVVYGDGKERTRDSPEARTLARRLAAEGMVLLKNEGPVLPVKPVEGKKVKVAIVGPNAKERIISGGGSAQLKPSYVVSPYEGILSNTPGGVEFSYEVGCYAHKYLPTLENNLTTPTHNPGWLCSFYNHDATGEPTGEPVAEFILNDTRVKLNDFLPAGLTPSWTIKLVGQLEFAKTAEYELGLTVAGRAKLFVDGKLTIDNWTKQRPGEFFYGQGTVEEKAVIKLEAARPVNILVEYTNTKPPNGPESDRSQPALMRGVRLGGCEKIDADKALESAVALAAKSDVVVVITGLSPEWEAEGFDRPTLDMPGRQNELITRLGKANPNTVVVLQAGSAVAMPWVKGVNAIIQAWYSGNEVGNALADIIYGKVNPSGRLPLTLPVREQDTPAYLNTRSENGQIHYREDLFVGYKWYHARDIRPLFPFGHGLSYTTFSLSNLAWVSSPETHDPPYFSLSIRVTNTGPVVGSEVVQVYVTLPDIGLTTPRLQLRGFAKARDVAPGQSTHVTVGLDKYAFAFWDVRKGRWAVKKGRFEISVGRSCVDLPLSAAIELENDMEWTGI
ncbi:glycoside hydrolase family 3 protein [Phlebiopsis gigantea 11061_1 CR5-6]|uniref:beta-glucosidase n=1 Tax=Phlebiopsis gigantea (strain 11061_1 CR5-6) TaxID=745531 RepID=A0A0C3PWK7_PHLG1|nr:glycoside hydrolase family 3 protein [Phlebiopsis gigantea 11061_1 CR5-6]